MKCFSIKLIMLVLLFSDLDENCTREENEIKKKYQKK